MADKWKVNDGTQVKFDGKLHAAGETFSATESQVNAQGLSAYVSKVRQQSQPKADNKAQAAPAARATSDKGSKPSKGDSK